MRKFLVCAVVTVISVILCALPGKEAVAGPMPDSFADLAETLQPAVVNISTTQDISARGMVPFSPFGPVPPEELPEEFREFFERFGSPFGRPKGEKGAPKQQAQSLGSGFVIDASGYVVTNHHVIRDADEISVIFNDDTSLEAEIIGSDPKTDIALLKVESDKPLPYVAFGDSDKIRVGDWIIAIGNPFGFGGSVTAGIISGRARNINAGPFDDFLQTDAAINRGNSGGPMFNLQGEVVGINTAIFSPSGGNVGIGFAVPSAMAQPIIEQLKQYGKTRRGWLGVKIQTVTEEMAESLGLDEEVGALVVEVTEGGPAEAAGVEVGDIILRFNGQAISKMRDLPRLVAEAGIGTDVKVTVLREGKEQTLAATLGDLEANDPTQKQSKRKKKKTSRDIPVKTVLGMELAELTEDVREQFALDEKVEGVLVVDVEKRSAVRSRGLRQGDIILRVNGDKVKNPDELEEKIEDARKADRKYALLRLQRGDDKTLFITIPTEEEDE